MENIIETFSGKWGKMGTEESTTICTSVGDIYEKDDINIEETNNLWIGLTAMQLDNIRDHYIGGTYYVTKFGETNGKYVRVLSVPSIKNGITISNTLADLLSLKEKDLIIIDRQIDNLGRVRIRAEKCEFNNKWSDTPIIGGISWNFKEGKIASMIVDIYPSEDYIIGLSAMHLDNLFGNTHPKDYAKIIYKDKKFKTKVYNDAVPGCGIGISRKLANDLGVIAGDLVFLEFDEELYNNSSAKIRELAYHCNFLDKWQETPIIGGIISGCESKSAKIAGMVVEIDNDDKYVVGLSAYFLSNLDQCRQYNPINIIYKDKTLETQVYNTWGMNCVPGCGIRISSKLVEDLDVKAGDLIFLQNI